ncbi:AraC family transcriptional regulator [Riemerella anatipestifer]|nr:AraC family transcriptional regulator [Riemerella anatipestifer]
MIEDRTRVNIMFSCISQEKKNFEPFVQDHALVCVLNGTMLINDGVETIQYNKGDIGFVSKNQLVKTQKIPQDNKPFMSISIFLSKEMLYSYSKEYHILPKGKYLGKPNFIFQPDPFLKGFFDSMLPYFECQEALTDNLATIKTFEIIELLLRYTTIQNLLFNFEEDFKIDLEAYMSKNYMHNIPLAQFAKLTGRSISTFKRDFQKIFNQTPNKWLIKKRLDLAYFLISKQGKKPNEIYDDVGFINFSHFSRSFKAEFGVNPSEIEKKHS